MEFQIHKCVECGAEFEVVCEAELLKKLREHKCTRVAGKVARTQQLEQSQLDRFVHDVVADRIHQHNFNRLIKQGMIVQEI